MSWSAISFCLMHPHLAQNSLMLLLTLCSISQLAQRGVLLKTVISHHPDGSTWAAARASNLVDDDGQSEPPSPHSQLCCQYSHLFLQGCSSNAILLAKSDLMRDWHNAMSEYVIKSRKTMLRLIWSIERGLFTFGCRISNFAQSSSQRCNERNQHPLFEHQGEAPSPAQDTGCNGLISPP